MTRLGKCEMCRNRKVKCDEQKPTCGACSKKSRPCIYKTAKHDASAHVVAFRVDELQDASTAELVRVSHPLDVDALGVKQVRQAQNGEGTFLTLGLSKAHRLKREKHFSSSPTPSLLCAQSEVSSQWGNVFGYDALGMNPLGEYVKTALLYATDHAALDLASRYALDSMLNFHYRDEETLMRAHKSGAKAISVLKTAVAKCSSTEDIRNLNLAVLMHFAAEHFISMGSYNYVPHILAFRSLLKLYRSRNGFDDLTKAIANSLCMDEIFESIMNGRDSSIFEGIFKPHLCNEDPSNRIPNAMEAAGSLLVELPRLVHLARIGTQGDGTEQLEIAMKRVLVVFDSDTDTYVKDTLMMHTKVRSCSDDAARPPCGMALDFDCQNTFLLAARYYVYRVIITGMLQKLYDHGHHDISLNISDVQKSNVEAATNITMCVPYALQDRPARPLLGLKIMFPLQMGVGSWLRLTERDVTQSQRAWGCINWTYDRMDEIGQMWKYKSGDLESLARIYDMFVGGPFHTGRGRQDSKPHPATSDVVDVEQAS